MVLFKLWWGYLLSALRVLGRKSAVAICFQGLRVQTSDLLSALRAFECKLVTCYLHSELPNTNWRHVICTTQGSRKLSALARTLQSGSVAQKWLLFTKILRRLSAFYGSLLQRSTSTRAPSHPIVGFGLATFVSLHKSSPQSFRLLWRLAPVNES